MYHRYTVRTVYNHVAQECEMMLCFTLELKLNVVLIIDVFVQSNGLLQTCCIRMQDDKMMPYFIFQSLNIVFIIHPLSNQMIYYKHVALECEMMLYFISEPDNCKDSSDYLYILTFQAGLFRRGTGMK